MSYRIMTPDVWSRTKFNALSREAQHLYLVVWTHPALTTAGTMDYKPRRLAALTDGASVQEVDNAAGELEEAGLLAVDSETEELALVSWWSDTTILRQPKVTHNAVLIVREIASRSIRQTIANELHRLRLEHPYLSGFHTEPALTYLEDNPPANWCAG